MCAVVGSPSLLRLQLVAAMSASPASEHLADPIDVVVADHFRIRAMLILVCEIARSRMSPRVREVIARSLLSFLRGDLEEHLRDEEEGLFPLLERRLTVSDLVDPSLRRIVAEHGVGRALGAELVGMIGRVETFAEQPPPATFRRVAASFARTKRHHVAVENGIVVPLARARFTARDLRVLGDWMIQRRCRRALCKAPHAPPSVGRGPPPSRDSGRKEFRQ